MKRCLKRKKGRITCLDAPSVAVAGEAFWEARLPSGVFLSSESMLNMLGDGLEPFPADYGQFLDRIHPSDRDLYLSAAGNPEVNTGIIEMELRLRHSNGFYIWVSCRFRVFRRFGGRVRTIAAMTDISDYKISHSQLIHATQNDQLTGLPNRTMFIESIRELEGDIGCISAVIYLDLDRFKHVNDSLGHSAGDTFIKKIAKRLLVYEGPNDIISRLGGDEFGFLIRNVTNVNYVRDVAEGILKIISLPLIINDHKIYPAASLGILIVEPGANDAETTLKKAEAAMYRAKDLGKNRYIIYQQEMNPEDANLIMMESALRRGLEGDEFVLHYQPVVSLQTGLVTGFEALVRWNRPDTGMVAPGGFINHAEETGLIVPLGEWIMNEACRQHQRWRQLGISGLHMAVNVSAYQFEQRKMLAVVNRALKEAEMDAKDLSIEVTESIVMKDIDYSRQVLQDLAGMGCNILIDDFGTGYSSFMYLKRFPFTILKIDKFFIDDLETDPESASITRAIIAVAHNMKLQVIAEGVETEGQLRFLQENNCDYIQGYYASRPVDSDTAGGLIGKPLLEGYRV